MLIRGLSWTGLLPDEVSDKPRSMYLFFFPFIFNWILLRYVSVVVSVSGTYLIRDMTLPGELGEHR